MMQSMTAAVVFGLVTFICGAALGQEPAEKFAGQIQTYTDAARSAEEALGTMLGLAQEMPAFSKGDVRLITAYMEEMAAAWSSAAAALKKGDEAEAAAFAKRAQEMDSKREIWSLRLGWRRGQAQIEYLPATEESFDLLVGDRKPEEMQAINAFIEAKKRRSEAYGRLADAAMPDADPKMLVRLQDEVFAADIEVQVANMKMDWANEDRGVRLWVTNDPSITSPELTEARQRLAEWRRRYEQTYRKSREIEHALEVQKREYKALFAAPGEAYKAAKAARERAKKAEKQG